MPDITYRISAAKYADFKAAFLRAHPVPTNFDGQPVMSEGDWIKEYGRSLFIRAYQRGKEQLAFDATSVDSAIVEVP